MLPVLENIFWLPQTSLGIISITISIISILPLNL